MSFITEIAHVNLTVPRGTLETAAEFYADTLALTRVPVPSAQTTELAW
jgi:4-hydroxyphenylpyruvate dioxygenase-like putative hemolysin